VYRDMPQTPLRLPHTHPVQSQHYRALFSIDSMNSLLSNVFSAFLFLICKRRKIFASLTFKNLYLHKTAYYLIVIHFRKNYKVFFCFS